MLGPSRSLKILMNSNDSFREAVFMWVSRPRFAVYGTHCNLAFLPLDFYNHMLVQIEAKEKAREYREALQAQIVEREAQRKLAKVVSLISQIVRQ
jgi:hypothetical protein